MRIGKDNVLDSLYSTFWMGKIKVLDSHKLFCPLFKVMFPSIFLYNNEEWSDYISKFWITLKYK